MGVNQNEAQLRWYLVDPSARGSGLGKQLMREAVQFSKDQSYSSIFLWTVATLKTAAHLYRSFGFMKTEEQPDHLWGVDVVEERYEMILKE